jgi:DNA invertase Pin-like site-specific DNA recombinase
MDQQKNVSLPVEDAPNATAGAGNSGIVRAVLAAQRNAEPAARQYAPSERRIGGYTRVAADEQKQKGAGLQKQRIGEYCAANLQKQPDAFYSDIGKSGSAIENRSALLELLAAAEAGGYTDIVIERYHRWSRNLYDAMRIAERLEKCGVRLHSWADNRELTKRDHILMAVRAEEDRRRRTSL